MAITISGENNNDKILASDGVIDQISGFSVVGVMTATSFTGDLTGNVVGNVVGNVTGNINNSTLLLQTGGSERFRITGNNELGIAGANYGTAGQVLTSGGSGSAVTWSAIPTQVTIANNADNRVITGGSGTNLNGEQRLTYNGSSFTNANVTSNEDSAINVYKATGDNADKAILRVGYDETNSFKVWRPRADAHIYMETSQSSSDIIINTNNGSAIGERLRIDASGRVMIGNSDAGNLYASGNNLVVGSGGASNQGITIYTGDVQQGILAFADGTSGGDQQYAGYMLYDHNTNNMLFATQATERLRIDSTGSLFAGGTVITESDLNWSHDTYQRPHIFSGITGGNPSDGAIVLASPETNPSNTRIGTLLFGCKTSSTSGVSNSGLKAFIQVATNSNVSDAWKTGGYMSFYTRPNSGNLAERLRVKSNGQIIIGNVNNTGGNINSTLHIESGGMNVESQYDTDDLVGSPPHLTLSGQSTRVRMDMGTMSVSPYAGWIQARYDNHPFGNSGTDDGLEPLVLNPVGGALGINVHDADALNNIGAGMFAAQGGIVIRAGRANSTTVNNASTAIKIFPGEVRAYSGSGNVGEQNQGTKYGGIAWNVLDPQNGGWGGNHTGHHCWMGMSLHSTPAQEKSNWQVQMNSFAGAGSFATNVAIQANPEGYVTHPNQPCMSVGLNRSDTNIGGGSDLFQTFSSVMFYDVNQGNIAFTSNNGRFTVPIDGNYMISFYSIKNGSGVQGYADIRVNGVNGSFLRAYSQNNATSWSAYNAFGIKTLSKGDYINVVFPGSAANWNAHGAQHLRLVIALYS